FADHVHVVRAAGGQVARDRAERLAEVGGHVHVGCEVVVAMIVERDVEGRRVEARRLDTTYVGAGGNAGETAGQVIPRAAVVLRQPDVAVVGAGVQQAGPQRRLGERDDRAVRLRARDVGRDTTRRARRDPDLHRVAGREVCRDGVEIFAATRGLHHFARAGVEDFRVV